MKILIAYYSRTGMTKKVADIIVGKISGDAEAIRDKVSRSGVKGYLISGRDAMKRKLTKLEDLKLDAEQYDLVIIGTPIWGWNMSTPIRTYITENKDKFKKVAFFCTMGGSGDQKAFLEMEIIIGKKPLGTLALKTAEVVKNEYAEKLEKYLEKLQ